MTLELLGMPDETWKRAAIGGIGGGVGFWIALSTVGGGDSVRLAVATGLAALVVMVVVNVIVSY